MSTTQDFTGYTPTWCPGCGNHGIGMAIKTALIKLNHDPSSLFVVFGIGCSGNMSDFLNAYAINALHGRAIPNAIGAKLANHKMKAIVVAGDGDCYGEGGNHFIHACRGNFDITVIVHDNRVYGLTTGQAAPTAEKGYKSKSTPFGIIEECFNPLAAAISQGATFVAQTFSGDMNHMTKIIQKGILHKGFSLINILQPCITFNKINTFKFYLKNSYKLSEKYNPKDKNKAMEKANELNSIKFPLGVLYKENNRKNYCDYLPQLKNNVLIKNKKFSDCKLLLQDFS